MLTVAPITLMIQAEEQAKRLNQDAHLWEDAPTPRWLAAIGKFAARCRGRLWPLSCLLTMRTSEHPCSPIS